jgi:calcineurin-like phosphoesterase family protein
MRFRDDIDLARTWLISDTHFGHKNIIGYCHRPENFEAILIEELARIPEGDTVLHLGDLCYKGNAWFKNVIAPKLAPNAGRKLLISGNHDHQRYSFYKSTGWKLTHPFMLAVHGSGDGVKVYPPNADVRIHQYLEYIVSFSHYAWGAEYLQPTPPRNHWRIHGHIHNNGYYDGRSTGDAALIPFLRNHINLSAEMTKYKPVNLKLLLDAVLLGRLPDGDRPSDGDAPSRSELEGSNPHA